MAAYEVLLLNTAVPQIQAAQSGDTYVVPRDIAFSAALTLSAGTANGVPYLNGSKVVTTGSALTFDGTNLGVGGTSGYETANRTTIAAAGVNSALLGFKVGGASAGYAFADASHLEFGAPTGRYLSWDINGEQMRLTSTGLGIGTSSPLSKLTVAANMASAGSEQLYITGTSNTQQLRIGYNTTGNYGVIQPVLIGTGYKDLVINPDGGNLGIGTSSPATKLDVNGLIRSAGDAANFLLLEKSANTGVYARWKRPNREYYLALDINNNGGNDFSLYDATAAATRWTVDASGNLGLGVTPSAWRSNTPAFQVGVSGGVSLFSDSGVAAAIGNNMFLNASSQYIYQRSDASSYYQQYQGSHSWHTAPSGTAGNAIAFTQALTLDANRNLLLNGTSAGASAVGTFAIFNGTAPTGSVTNGIILYAEDVSSSSELKVRDEAGNVTTLSPHNFSLIPEGPSEDMAWAYYSEKGGKRINVDMLKLARMVEKLTGEKLVYEA